MEYITLKHGACKCSTVELEIGTSLSLFTCLGFNLNFSITLVSCLVDLWSKRPASCYVAQSLLHLTEYMFRIVFL